MLAQVPRVTVGNGILANLSQSDLAAIRPYLEPASLQRRAVLQEPNDRISRISFIERGVVSLRTIVAGNAVETALVGCHGAVGASFAAGVGTSIHRAIVLVPGNALTIRVENVRDLLAERPQIRENLLQCVKSQMVHIAQTALCGLCHHIEHRLACWLCLACDALQNNVVPITHDHLSLILGLRRASVTEALGRFEECGFVNRTRGVLQIADRRSLQQKACVCYGVIANGYPGAHRGTKNPV